MKITKDTVVVMDYELRLDESDEVIDSSDDGTFAFLVGHENIVPGLEAELLGLTSGASKKVAVTAAEGYGERDESKVMAVPRSVFPEDFYFEVGIPVELEDDQGESFPVWIQGVKDDHVELDGNHPLAGETLNFTIKVLEVRAATTEELAHGHVHGAGDHHHH